MGNDSVHPLRRWRLNHDLTQAELGERVGVAKSAISKYEAGGIPKRSTMERLGAVTGLGPADFYPAPSPSPRGGASPAGVAP
jgi:transcriptional regulator with XRE-family HTH domain